MTGAQDAGPVQNLWHIVCPIRGKYALKHYGEVVATVLRPDAADSNRSQAHGFGDGPIISGGGWDTLSWFVRGETYDHMAEIARHVYGL